MIHVKFLISKFIRHAKEKVPRSASERGLTNLASIWRAPLAVFVLVE